MSELRSCSMCGKKLEWIDDNYGGLVPACTNRQCENYEFPLYENGLFEDDEDAEIAALRQSLAERDAEIERLREAQRWIPVSDSKSLNDLDLYLVTDGEIVSVGFYNTKWGTWTSADDLRFPFNITHYMPLPQPPQEAEG